ncbi:hypothetical protein BLNAU_8084 [Blattamonas nauphoetae]|uniref:Cyclin N-terminal domain-containing protein n=1 Tax=Blattamonas nauphoetae TaxID=2049346 RepID=A0ABQ9XZZ5_9EUKA|nr:hypothetical protein BLNAU_8084 [Blattamonas nauphoetae]
MFLDQTDSESSQSIESPNGSLSCRSNSDPSLYNETPQCDNWKTVSFNQLTPPQCFQLPASFIQARPDLIQIDNLSIPSDFFFRHYLDLPEAEYPDVTPSQHIISDTSKHLASYINSDPKKMEPHVSSIYAYLGVDEEIFLTGVIVLYKYLKAASKILHVTKDSELFYLLILCLVIALKGLTDAPLDTGSVLSSLHLEPKHAFHNEIQIMSALNFSLFFKTEEIQPLFAIFPQDGFRGLTFCADGLSDPSYSQTTASTPSLIDAFLRNKKGMQWEASLASPNAPSPTQSPNTVSSAPSKARPNKNRSLTTKKTSEWKKVIDERMLVDSPSFLVITSAHVANSSVFVPAAHPRSYPSQVPPASLYQHRAQFAHGWGGERMMGPDQWGVPAQSCPYQYGW